MTRACAALVVAMLLPAAAAAGLDCLDHAAYVRTLVNHTDLESATDLWREGDLVYVVATTWGLSIVDIGNPLAPRTVGRVETPGWAQQVVVAGRYAYVADQMGGVAVIDVSDPTAPVLVRSVETDAFAMDVLVDEGILYVADFSSGLRIFDLADPAQPGFLASFDTEGGALALAKAGARLYVAGQGSGLYVFNVADQAHPFVTAYTPMTGDAYSVTVAGDHAYVGGASTTLTVFDVAEPQLAVVVGELDLGEYGRRSCLVGDDLYLACGRVGLRRIDVGDPTAPNATGRNVTPGSARDVLLLDAGRALVADGASLVVTDITDMTPIPEPIYYDAPVAVRGIAAQGDYAYVAAMGDGLAVLDIGDPKQPRFLASVATVDTAMGVAVDGDLAVVADQDAGLAVLDVSDPGAPDLVGSLDLAMLTARVTLADRRAYPCGYATRLVIVDVGDPRKPALLCDEETGDHVYEVLVRNQLAYVAAGNSGLRVFDVGDPTAPVLVGELDLPYCVAIAGEGDHLYLTQPGSETNNWLHVVDVADPVVPQLVTSVRLPDRCYRVTVHEGTVYATGGQASAGTAIVDVHAPAAARLLYWRIIPAWTAEAVAANGALLVAAAPGLAIMPLECAPVGGVETSPPAAAGLRLAPNVPNPFNPATTVHFELARPQTVSLRIYDLAGRLVACLLDDQRQEAGPHGVRWDGRDAAGRAVASGVYRCVLDGESGRDARSLLLLR